MGTCREEGGSGRPPSWPGPRLNLQVRVLEMLRGMLGGMAVVEGFGIFLCYPLEGPLDPHPPVESQRAGNGDVCACPQVLSLQVFTKAIGLGMGGEQCALGPQSPWGDKTR